MAIMSFNFYRFMIFSSGFLITIHGINSSTLNLRSRVLKTSDLCYSPKIDAITRTNDGNTYVFKDSYYWRVTDNGLAPGYPRLIQRDWPGLPGKIDAALTWRDGKTFFFKGDSYWRFKSRAPVSGYPKKISVGFAGIPDDIDAALLWGGNANTYFFKGDQYWKFETQSSRKKTAMGYPKNISVWAGVPSNLDAAFQWENSKTYFFKGNQYYGFDDKKFKVQQHEDFPYPRNTATWWFGCRLETSTTEVSTSSIEPSTTVASTSSIETSTTEVSTSSIEPFTTVASTSSIEPSITVASTSSIETSTLGTTEILVTNATTSITKIVTTEDINNSLVHDEPNLYDYDSSEEIDIDNFTAGLTDSPKSESHSKEFEMSIAHSTRSPESDAIDSGPTFQRKQHEDDGTTSTDTRNFDPEAVPHISRVSQSGATKSTVCFALIAVTCFSMLFVSIAK